MSKADLRTAARQRRKQFVAERGGAMFPADSPVVAHLRALLPPKANVAGYIAMHSEADPARLLHALHAEGATLCLPWIGNGSAEMLFRTWAPDAVLEMSPAKFVQPLPSARALVPDIIILPLLGFDRAGNRLGQGAGHYDRALVSRQQALRIGLGWSVQAFESLPADPWDMPLDAVMTEAEWIIPAHSRIRLD